MTNMYKNLIIISLIFLLVIAGFGLVMIAPYHIYTLTLTEGVDTQFLKIKPSAQSFYDGQAFSFKKNLGTAREDESLYVKFHFSNFLIPLPLNQPVFALIPTIKVESTGPRLGGSYLDGKNAELFTFTIEKNLKFETSSGDQKLFLLPIFKNYISKKNETEIWKDIFSKKLSLPANIGKSFYETLFTLRKESINDLVYNLFILYNRIHFLPNDSIKISYDQKSGHGLVELPSTDPKFRVEKFYIYDNGIVYSIMIKTKISNQMAEHFRERVLLDTVYKSSSIDSAIPIYAQYKNISYGDRIDQQGMTYLFSAWSHDVLNREYVRVIILFLERGKANLKYLKPFYEYAYKKFGSNLSSENEILLESADEKLKRKMKDEIENEVKKAEQSKSSSFDGNFSTPEEKIKFNLQKAKDIKINSDESNHLLLQE